MDIGSGINWVLAFGWLTLSIAAAGVWFIGGMFFNSANQKKYVKGVAMVLGIFAIAAAFGWSYDAATGDAGEVVDTTAEWGVTMTSNATADGFVTITSLNTAIWVYTDAGNDTAYINFTVAREDTGAAWAYTKAEVATIGTFENETSGISSAIISKTDDQYDADWENSQGDTANMEMAVPYGEVRTETVGCLIELNTGTIGAMDSLDQVPITFNVAGETFTVFVQKA